MTDAFYAVYEVKNVVRRNGEENACSERLVGRVSQSVSRVGAGRVGSGRSYIRGRTSWVVRRNAGSSPLSRSSLCWRSERAGRRVCVRVRVRLLLFSLVLDNKQYFDYKQYVDYKLARPTRGTAMPARAAPAVEWHAYLVIHSFSMSVLRNINL